MLRHVRAAMCLIVFAWVASPKTRLVVAANRDEFFARRAAPAAWWKGAPDVLAGRDLEAGGTWLGITRAGRFAALTNFRDASAPKRDGAPSRGALAADFLRGGASAADYVAGVQSVAFRYHGFNLLASDGAEMWSFSNVEGDPVRLGPGIRGLSNHLLETPWPKVTAARSRLEAALGSAHGPAELERLLLDILADRTTAPDGALPATGLPPVWERALSAAFVELPGYGTLASTALVVGADGSARFVERTFGKGGAALGEVREAFEVSAARKE
ncbi:MAG: NRDE family protein [Thermoanaerobaculia bacterium]